MKISQPIVLLVILAGCAHDEAAIPDESLSEGHATRHRSGDDRASPPLDHPDMVRFHMARSFDDLRRVERLLVTGKLDEATTVAHLLTRATDDPGLAAYRDDANLVAVAASALEHASTLAEALRREPMVAAACADCHERTHAHPAFSADPAPQDRPTGDGSAAGRAQVPAGDARIARHQWAVDRLWEGMVGADPDRWQTGLEMLASTPVSELRPKDAARLQELARAAASKPAATAAERVAAYGEILATCVACHATGAAEVARAGR